MPFDRNAPLPDAGIVGVSEYDQPDPSFLETLGAAYRQDNIIGSSITRASNAQGFGELNTVDPNYDVFSDIKGYEDQADRFEEIYNRNAANSLKAQIDQEKKDRATLAASGWTGFGLSTLAGITDLPTLIPGGALARSGKVGYSTLRSAAAVGVAAGVGTAVQEAGLQATQEMRTPEESALAIGGSVLLGGIIGAGASKFLSHGEWSNVSKSLEADLASEVPNPVEVTQTIVQRMQSAGAAAVDDIKLDDLGIGGGRAAQIVAKATDAARLNPGIQTMFSPSKTVREVYGRLVDNPVYTKMQMEGRSLGPDVENTVKLYLRGALGDWLGSSRQIYKEAKKAGYTGTKTEFYEAVAKAGRRGDVDVNGNEFITRAAQEARSKVFDPLLERAKRAGLLPEDVKVSTSASYVTRLWNRQKLIGEEGRFRAIARQYFSQELDRAVIRQDERHVGNKIVETMGVDDRLNKAVERLQNIGARLSERQKVRGGKLARVQSEEARRFDYLSERAPKPVVEALRSADQNQSIMGMIREGRKAMASKPAKYPILGVIRNRGGVRIGSPLHSELKRMGVSNKTYPGLFRSEGGRGAADNIAARDYDIFESAPVDANGYVDQNFVLDAIRDELAGSPLRTAEGMTRAANDEAAIEAAQNWLESVGIHGNATVREVRERISEVLRGEKELGEADTRVEKLNRELEEFDQATDKLANERIVSQAEFDNVADELRTLEEEINANADLAKSSPAVARMVDYAKARRDYGRARYEQVRVTNRLEALRRVDAEGKLTPELDAEIGKLEIEAKEIEKRITKAAATSDKLKPMLPKKREEIPDFIDASDRNDYIDQIVTSVFNNLTGRGAGDVPEWIVPVKRGPLKERTFNIPDEMVEDFLENDMEAIMRKYTRTMGAEVELADKFGSADMKEQFEAINREYDDLSAAAKTPAERQKLNAARDRDIKNLSAFRDMIRGTYRAAENGSEWSKITRAALTWNYIRLLGGVTLASLTDASRFVGVHGVRATMREAIPALVKGVKAAQISRADAKALGAVTERVLESRLASFTDLTDPYAHGSRFERFLSNTSHAFSKATGLGWWNDTLKTVASVMTQNRMMRNALDWNGAGKTEQAYMAFLGVDEDMAQRIASQFRKHGIEQDGIYGANVGQWDDELAARAWAAALNKDVDRTIVTKGVADTPLWTKTNWGRLIFQFKSFGLASHQRVLIAGLQERPHRLAEMMVMSTALGMLVGYLKYMERGDVDEANRLLNNPGLWVTDGLDRSGILSIPFEISNTAEKLGTPGIMTAAQAIAGDPDRGGSASRYASRGVAGALLGPSIGIMDDLKTINEQLMKGDLKKSGANAIIRQLPGATLPGIRTAIHVGVKPAFVDAVK